MYMRFPSRKLHGPMILPMNHDAKRVLRKVPLFASLSARGLNRENIQNGPRLGAAC